MRALVPAIVFATFVVPTPATAGNAKPAHTARRANARTGRLAPAFAELVKAYKHGDRAALARAADRMGLVRLGDAIASREPGVSEAALSVLPAAHGGVLLIGAATDQVAVSDWARAAAAAAALGSLLDGAVPSALEEWEVPPDVVARACTALRALAWRADATVATRLAALDAVAAAAPSCGGGTDLAPLARDGAPALRRAAVMVAGGGGERDALLRDAIADSDKNVSAAATALACRYEARIGRGGKAEAPLPQAVAAARAMAAAPATPPEDAVEMLDCLAAAGTPQDRALLDELQRRPPSPLRDRAVELGVRPPSGKP